MGESQVNGRSFPCLNSFQNHSIFKTYAFLCRRLLAIIKDFLELFAILIKRQIKIYYLSITRQGKLKFQKFSMHFRAKQLPLALIPRKIEVVPVAICSKFA